jgi:hypothetical protein
VRASNALYAGGIADHTATAAEHAHELRRRLLGAAEVQDQEVAHDGVEGGVVEWKLVCVGSAEVEAGMQSTGEDDHRVGDVHPNHRRASLGRSGRDVPRTGGGIQGPCPPSHRGRVQQRIHQPPGDAAEEVVIAGRPRSPSFRLEGVEGVRIDGGLSHALQRYS